MYMEILHVPVNGLVSGCGILIRGHGRKNISHSSHAHDCPGIHCRKRLATMRYLYVHVC